jgi:hypothetical protein
MGVGRRGEKEEMRDKEEVGSGGRKLCQQRVSEFEFQSLSSVFQFAFIFQTQRRRLFNLTTQDSSDADYPEAGSSPLLLCLGDLEYLSCIRPGLAETCPME